MADTQPREYIRLHRDSIRRTPVCIHEDYPKLQGQYNFNDKNGVYRMGGGGGGGGKKRKYKVKD